MTTKTDRDYWADPASQGGIFAWSLIRGGQVEDIRDGLKAFAAAWFDTYEDETDLPAAWFKLKELAEAFLAEDLFEEDEDDEDDES